MNKKKIGDKYELLTLKYVDEIVSSIYGLTCNFQTKKRIERFYTKNISESEIDIFGENNESIVIIECKAYTYPIDQNLISSFITKVNEISRLGLYKNKNVFALFITKKTYNPGAINYLESLKRRDGILFNIPINFKSLKLLQLPTDYLNDYVVIYEYSASDKLKWNINNIIVPVNYRNSFTIDENFEKISKIKNESPLLTVKNSFVEIIQLAFDNVQIVKKSKMNYNIKEELIMRCYYMIGQAYMELGLFPQAVFYTNEAKKYYRYDKSIFYNCQLVICTSEYNINNEKYKNRLKHPGKHSISWLLNNLSDMPIAHQLQTKLFVGKKMALNDSDKEFGLKMLHECELEFDKLNSEYGLFFSYYRQFEANINNPDIRSRNLEKAKNMILFLKGISKQIGMSLIDKTNSR